MIFRKHYLFITAFVVFLSLSQIIRLLYIICIKGYIVKLYSQKQYKYVFFQPAYRYSILDRYKNYLARTYKTCSLYFYKNDFVSDETIQFLSDFFPDSLKKIKIAQKNDFIYIARNESKDIIKKIGEYKVADIFFHDQYGRFYGYNSLLPLLGFVDIDMHGLAGLEFAYDKDLFYADKRLSLSRFGGEKSVYFPEHDEKNKTLHLTIDGSLSQSIVCILENVVKKYQSEYASALVLNGRTGEIISVVQYPFYNKKDCTDIAFSKPLAITNAYELGSVFKAFSMLAAFAEKAVDENELIDCKGAKSAYVNGVKINTHKAASIIPFYQIIQESNNIGIAQVAMRIGKKLYDHYTRLGFGKKLDMNYPGQAIGSITHPKTWSKQSIFSLSYGYEVSASLLQLVVAWSVFVNNGKKVTPTFFFQKNRETAPLYDIDTIITCKRILEYEKSKLPKKYHAILDTYKMYGKTGTANILQNGVYDNTQNTYCFIGSLENDNAAFIIGVYVRNSNKKNLYGSMVALPLFLEIAQLIVARSYKLI